MEEGVVDKAAQDGCRRESFKLTLVKLDFWQGRKIWVRIGSDLLPYGTPQGSMISPLLFVIMLNEVF